MSRICQLENQIKDLQACVALVKAQLASQVDVDTDEQTLTLLGNIVTLSAGVSGGGGTFDLSPYLDNTDSQVLSANVVGSNLVLTISGGNTVSVPLASLGSDDQLLTLTGSNLTIENGNTVNLSAFLDNTDQQTLTVTNPTTAVLSAGATGGGGTLNLNTTTELILHERYRGRSSNGTTVQHAVNATMTRTAAGRWQVRFTGGTHPNGESYTPSVVAEEQGNLRDTPDITIVQGTQNASGFDVQITTGDNGGGADVYVDTPWSWGVESPVNVITSATLS